MVTTQTREFRNNSLTQTLLETKLVIGAYQITAQQGNSKTSDMIGLIAIPLKSSHFIAFERPSLTLP